VTRRIHIKRLELDLRGVDPKTAEAATRRLGPSLERALAQRRGHFDSAHHIDAGGIAPSNQSHDIASSLAHRIAQRVKRK
jgi:hypothetical protein